MAFEKHRTDGIAKEVDVERETQAWEQDGPRVVRGKKIIALVRQVRGAAGSLVLIGTCGGAVESTRPGAATMWFTATGSDRRLR